jgi:predicted nucleotide-binding protein (sugar kinase/HSP70/actin superfamily)
VVQCTGIQYRAKRRGHKLWTAKFVARHSNLISVELSNFKCGPDAFISRTIEEIIERSGKPHFSFRDLDENRPLASIRIRVETMHYFLSHYQEKLQRPYLSSSLNPGHSQTLSSRRTCGSDAIAAQI